MFHFVRTASLLLLAPAFLALSAQDTSAKFPTNEQLRHIKAMADPRLAPDGKEILLRITESTADGAKSHIWLTTTGSDEPRQLTFSPDADKRGEHDAEWMPDGQSILFLAKRGEHEQLFQLPMMGGEAKAFDLKITPVVDQSKLADALPLKTAKQPGAAADTKSDEVAIDVSQFAVAPNGKVIAILADDPETPGEKAQKEAKADAEWVDHNPHGSRLYLLDVATNKLAPIAVEPDVHGVAWSDDSTRIVATVDAMNNAADLGPAKTSWLIALSNTAHPQKLGELPPTIGAAAWTLDRKSIVFLAQAKHDAPPGYSDLFIHDLTTRASRNLSDGLEGSLRDNEPIPLEDGSVVQAVEFGFNGKVAVYTPGSPEPRPLAIHPSNITAVTTNLKRTGWLFLGSSGGQSPALYYSDDLKTEPRIVKTPPLSADHLLSVAPKKVEWKSDSFTIEGRLYLPPDAATKKVPLIVEVHGGPLGAYADGHEPWIDFLLGQGWAVLRANPRGSSGYGAAFAAANKNDLGGGDYRDIMAGVDYVLKTEPIDADRMALVGYSYGGEMAGFVEGRTTRFKAIISGAPVVDQYSEYGTESDSWYDRWYFGKPWEHAADTWRQSPLANAGKAKTPFLLLQGESDTTDPLGQSQEMYRSLRQVGVPVELVTYPRDNHGPLARAMYGAPVPEPWHGYDARRRVVDFIEKNFASPAK